MQPYELSRSRTYPTGVARAFDVVLPISLPRILGHRSGPIPGIVDIRDQDGDWGSVGQTRTIVMADRGTAREELTAVSRPQEFRYRITDLRGPMRPLVAGIDGRWSFEKAGTGVRVTWSWRLTPTSRATARLMPLVGRFWRPWAARALENIEADLVSSG